MYLVDYNGDLIDVPVKIQNYQLSGEYINRSKFLNDWALMRRFFIYDTLSGVEDKDGGYRSGAMPTVVRYAKKMSLKI